MSPRDEARAEEIRQWTAANQRAREEYAAYPFAHSREKTVVRDRAYHAERQAAYRARKAGKA